MQFRVLISTALLGAALLAACRTVAPPVVTQVPDPLAPPLVGAALGPEQQLAVRSAVAAAEAGRGAEAARYLAQLPAGHPVQALASLEVAFLAGQPVAKEAAALAASEAGYGAAWGLTVLACQREGDLRGTMRAARTAAELQPDARWGTLADEAEAELRKRLVAGAARQLQMGDAEAALESARETLAEFPDLLAARMVAIRALLALDNVGGAAGLVPGLPDTDEGLEIKGKVAERLGQWDLAVDLYSRLREGDPRRCELIEGARTQLRLANAPPYLRKALAATSLNRRGLAAILVWSVPTIARHAGGAVPVFEDVVHLQERADILVVARAGIISGDAIARAFGPERTVSQREFMQAAERVASLVGRPMPAWCEAEASTDGHDCIPVPASIGGAEAVTMINAVVGEGGTPCQTR